ncbi:hypothetical protein M878_35905 [Streptomyces roseochromogenus subsp. oscitans DS 12.976]|uniref:Nuclear transport factor 2 family protein n=2 Tax=Streptomyces roseochromogenus TaxID=285450 RepID=V6JS02_STRRC|nr:hypothetical protein M878_35905 [Streptomyces roseochromogenus subsp. oscitans DS 12.976]
MTPWTRRTLAALAVCLLPPLGAAGCTTGHAHGGTVSSSPVGKVLDGTDETGRHLREVDRKNAPEVGVEVTPHSGGGWDVRLSFRHFRCSAPGTAPTAVTGRGLVHLLVDGHQVAGLRTRAYRLPDRLVPHGTHHVTARLYADDGTVWAVHGRPVQSTADITVSDVETATATAQPPTGTETPVAGK